VIHIESTATIEQLLIYNSTGQLIKAITPTQMPTQIDISDLNSGFVGKYVSLWDGERSVCERELVVYSVKKP